ncbi:uncharacterized protein LOC132601203 [Lycium barbarum]|uniref:uncharacterized protein LOC132601203 n=1 Tax=Lycium barbarum TaxID=112863 RepID=UPI00293F2F2E|nr:uncharacterized protein LOC132601203 [Lycium barbarum]
MYHFINDLVPTNQRAKNLQLYLFDSENELQSRMACSNKLNEKIVKSLMDILKSYNPYSKFLKSLINISQLSGFYIALRCDAGLDQRIYNLPTVSEVGGIWVENDNNNCVSAPHIRIYTESNRSQIVNYYYGRYDSLQYPLLLPYGQNGWHCGIKKIKPSNVRSNNLMYCEHEELPNVKNMCSIDGFLHMEAENMQKGKRKRNTVSCREYYCYKLQIRNDENIILHYGRLFQQYAVDEWIKIESQRLDFASLNQDLFRIDMLEGLLDMLRRGEREASQIGRNRYHPHSFTRGPRDMRRRYMDAIALVQRFGKPDIFLTMTYNPTWPEIKANILQTDEVQNRPDLVSRIFHAKLEELKKDILRRNIFGKVATFMYTVEFQKRGLPHAHFLIILDEKYKLLTPEAYDKYVCAELPDPDTNPELYALVTKHMIHGPCGALNPASMCTRKKGYCKFKYPKEFAEQTTKGKNSYPIYKRRNTGKSVQIREHLIDNSWVVPYNPSLLCKFSCHINVEICSYIKVIKYIYKYICKGHDKIAFNVHSNDTNIEIDEIKEYQSARWVWTRSYMAYICFSYQ